MSHGIEGHTAPGAIDAELAQAAPSSPTALPPSATTPATPSLPSSASTPRLGLWTLQPNRRRARFYNFWGGSRIAPTRFRHRLAGDLTKVLTLVADGALTGHVAARIPLHEASRAMALAESRTVLGKVVLIP